MTDSVIEAFELVADSIADGGQAPPKLPPGFPAGSRREQQRHRRTDDRPNQKAQPEAAGSGRASFLSVLRGVHGEETSGPGSRVQPSLLVSPS